MRTLHSGLLAAALAACAGTPIDQGGNAEIVFAQSDMIRIRWNPQRTNEGVMRSKAIAFCGGRKVEPLESAIESSASGSVVAKTWRCEPFPGNGTGM